MVKNIFLIVFLLILVLVGILIVRTMMLQKPAPINAQSMNKPSIKIDREQSVERLAKAITFKTISTPDGNKPHADQFKAYHDYLRANYPNVFSKLTVKEFGPFGLLFVWQGTESTLKPILLMSHQDVVPIAQGTEEQWQQPPFAGNIIDGYVWGRGTLDIKSGVMSILEAVELSLQNNLQPKRSIYIFFGDDEEIGGRTAVMAAQFFKDKKIQFAYVLDEGMAIINDPIPGVSGPVAFISVAEKGYVDLILSNVASGGHSSMPPPQTSIGKVARAISRLEADPFPAHLTEIQRKMLLSMAPYMNFTNKLAIANLWLFSPVIKASFAKKPTTNASIRTTTAATVFNAGVKENVLPIKATATINFRILPGDTVDYVKDRVRNVINDDSVTIDVGDTQTNPSPISSTSGIGYETISTIVRELYDDNIIIAPYMTVGATDSRHFISVSDNVYRFMCYELDLDDATRIHGTNERISVNDYERMIQFYLYLLANQ